MSEVTAITILATSPRKSNYHLFSRLECRKNYYMPLWSWSEIHLLNSLSYFLTEDTLVRKYLLFSGVPRFVFGSDEYEQNRKKAIDLADLDKCLKSHEAADSFEDVSHYIIQIVPIRDYEDSITIFLCPSVGEAIIANIKSKHKQQLIEFLKDSMSPDLADLSSFRASIYENMTHLILSGGGEFPCYGPLTDGSIPVTATILKIPKCSVTYVPTFENSAEPNIYYRPPHAKFPVIDAWISDKGFFQMTTAKKRKPLAFDYLYRYMKESEKKNAQACSLFFVVLTQNRQSITKKIHLQTQLKRKLDVSEDVLTQMKQYVENNLNQYVVVVDLSILLPSLNNKST